MHPSIPHLRTQKVFAPLIRKHGEPKLRRGKNAFQALARAIIYQQISTAAATSVYRKFVGLYGIRVEAPIDWESAKGWGMPDNF
jgi:3-methyladenine DNA glycosylase/8-oxoguanine DNA glycosylase